MVDIALNRVQRLKQGIILFLALAASSILAATLVYTFARDALYNNLREELIATARIASLAVDPSAHRAILENPRATFPPFRLQQQKLKDVVAKTKDARSIYTLQKVGSSVVYMVDAGEPVDINGDGRPDSPLPYDAYRGDESVPLEVFRTGLPRTVTSRDEFGPYWTTFVPVLGDYGQVAVVLGMDTNSQRVNRRLEDLTQIFSWAVVLALLLSAGTSGLYAVHYLTGEARFEEEGRGKFVARQIIEIMLAVFAAVCAVAGIACQAALISNRAERDEEMRHVVSIQKAEGIVIRVLAGDHSASTMDAATRLASSRTPWLASRFAAALAGLQKGDPAAKPVLRSLIEVMDQEGMDASFRLMEKQAIEARLSANLNRSLLGVLFVVGGSFFLLRLRSRRDQALLKAVKQGRRAQSDLGQIVENIPIGLFTWGDGKVHFSNPAWRQMLGLSGEQATGEQALAKVHPTDRGPLLSVLEGPLERESAEIQFRVLGSHSRMRHLALKAVPIPGEEQADRMILAFTLDITDSVEVRNSLQTKGQEVELKNRMLAAALEDLEANLESVVRCLVRAVEAKDPYTAGHSERVMEYSLWIGEELGLGPYEMRVLELGTLVHDVGKIGIPDAILTKPAGLTESEYAHIQQHPELGVRILEGIGLFQDCMPIVRWHHERLDGSGYPDGLAGEEIPFLVRISAVADVFDAMTSTRAYRAGIEPQIVLRVMREDGEKGLLDPVVVESLDRAVRRKGVIPQGDAQRSLRKTA